MEKYFNRISKAEHSSSKKISVDVDMENPPADSVQRPKNSGSQSDDVDKDCYLTCIIDAVRFFVRQGWEFDGRLEFDTSYNRGNFLEFLVLLGKYNEKMDKAIKNAGGNLSLVAPPTMQKDILSAASMETTCAIVNDIGTDFFAILIDESHDSSIDEQMAIVLRYVNNKGSVVERFLSLVLASDTSASSLLDALKLVFAKHSLDWSRVRGQSYEGINGRNRDFSKLKSLILEENKSAFYVHCFAHQLELALIAMAQEPIEICCLFYNFIAVLVNVVGASCKGEGLQSSELVKVKEALQCDEISTSPGLIRESAFGRAKDIRCISHYKTISNLIHMFPSVINLLEVIEEDGKIVDQRIEAGRLLDRLCEFEIVFTLHLMNNVLGTTNELCQALQRGDIIKAMQLVNVSKKRLQMMRDDGWPSLLDEVYLFCEKNNIVVLKMEDPFKDKSRRKVDEVSNLNHFQVELFYQVVDSQLQELNDRFTEENMELLLCVACLSPEDSFVAFDKEKLVRLAQLYPHEFSSVELLALDSELNNYIMSVRSDKRFDGLKGISDLSEKMVETRMHNKYSLVYLLLKLALILPIAPASVERVFSTMKFMKSQLRNCVEDEWLGDYMVTCIEEEIFNTIDKEKIKQRYQKMISEKEHP